MCNEYKIDFIENLNIILENEYELVGEYKGAKTNTDILHKRCGKIISIRPEKDRLNKFKKSGGCKFCKFEKEKEEYINKINEMYKGEYLLAQEYVGKSGKILMIHTKCGKKRKYDSTDILRGLKCNCNVNRTKENVGTVNPMYQKDLDKKFNNRFIILSKYYLKPEEQKKKITGRVVNVKCLECNNTFEAEISNLKINGNCPCCNPVRITTDIYKKRVALLVGSEYEVLGEYINSDEKILIKHSTCGYSWDVQPSAFIRGCRCPKCKGGIKKTNEEFLIDLKNKRGEEYTPLEPYNNANTKILFKHNNCGNIFKYKPSIMTNSKYIPCPKCRTYTQRTDDDYKNEINELYKGEFTVLGEFTGVDNFVKLKHNKCGYEWEGIAKSMFKSSVKKGKCPNCNGTRIYTKEEFEEEILKNKLKGEYSLVGDYYGMNEKTLFKHNKCGRVYKTAPGRIKRGVSCKVCKTKEIAIKITKTTEQFKEEVINLVGDEYSVLGEYVSAKKRLKVKHNKCGHIWKTTPTSFLSGSRCPKCMNGRSKGEMLIEDILENHNIKYKTQYKFKNCVYVKPLLYDFAIYNKYNELIMLIEFDGIQHYKPVIHFGGISSHIDLIKKDRIKTQYCRDNNIPLIRIPYWEFSNIQKILLTKLYRFGLLA